MSLMAETLYELRYHSALLAGETTLRYGLWEHPEPESALPITLIIISGMGGSIQGGHRYWRRLLPQVQSLVAVSIPGFGENQSLPLESPQSQWQRLEQFFLSRPWEGHLKQPSLPWALSAISLGTLMASRFATHATLRQRLLGLMLTSAAWKGHQSRFSPGFVGLAVLKYFLGVQPQLTLQYGLAQLTRGSLPTEAEFGSYAATFPLTLPMSYLIHLVRWPNETLKQLLQTAASLPPSYWAIAKEDVVCDTDLMLESFQKLKAKSDPKTPHQVHVFEAAYHDLFVEAEATQLADQHVAWLRTLQAPEPTC
jgi:alpha-beta hydrolase superfamily lysophospholipase